LFSNLHSLRQHNLIWTVAVPRRLISLLLWLGGVRLLPQATLRMTLIWSGLVSHVARTGMACLAPSPRRRIKVNMCRRTLALVVPRTPRTPS